jgi:hypothetical protein
MTDARCPSLLVSLSLEKVFLQICVLFRFIPERFTLVKLEGYAVFMGPELFIASPGFPARLPLVEIGQNFPVEIGHFIDFKLFFFGFAASNYVSGVEIHNTRIFS